MTKTKKVTKRRKGQSASKAMLDDKLIAKLAIKAGCPIGWVDGPWFDKEGSLRTGMPDCMRDFVKSVLSYNTR